MTSIVPLDERAGRETASVSACRPARHGVRSRSRGAGKVGGVVLPPGYFNLIGSIDDETFVRPPQGELPPPVEME